MINLELATGSIKPSIPLLSDKCDKNCAGCLELVYNKYSITAIVKPQVLFNELFNTSKKVQHLFFLNFVLSMNFRVPMH